MIVGRVVDAGACPLCDEPVVGRGCWEGEPTDDDLAWLAQVMLAAHIHLEHPDHDA